MIRTAAKRTKGGDILARMLRVSWRKRREEKDVSIKMFFKDVDDFLKQIRTIDKVKFVAKSNLFSVGGGIFKIFPNPQDIYGLGMPDSLGVEASFTNANKTEDFV